MGTDPEQALWFRTCHAGVKAELSARAPGGLNVSLGHV